MTIQIGDILTTESYYNITTGINELTSKITCYDNSSNITNKDDSVNVTGS